MGKERVAVVGIGQTKHQATRGDVSMAGLVREAASRALADAEMTWADIDAVVIGKAPDFFEGVMMPELYLADALGAAGKPLFRVHTAGSVGGSTAIVASQLVQAGIHKRVLTVCFEKQSESEAMWALSMPIPFQPPLHAGAGGYFAPHIRSYMARSKAPDHIGILVALKDRLNALKNPYAHLHEHDITLRLHQGLDDAVGPDPLRRDLPAAPTAPARSCWPARTSPTPARGPVAWIQGTAMRSEPTMSAEPRHRAAPRRRRLRRRRLQAGRHHRPAQGGRLRRDVRPVLLVRAHVAGEPAASRRAARAGSSWRTASPSSTATSRSTCPAACCRPTRSAPPACSASPRPPCRCGARPASTRSTAPAPRWATPTAAAPSSSPCGSSARRSR